MKKLFPLFALGAVLSFLSLDSFADDDAKYQYFIACGKVYAADANLSAEELLELIDKTERTDCPDEVEQDELDENA